MILTSVKTLHTFSNLDQNKKNTVPPVTSFVGKAARAETGGLHRAVPTFRLTHGAATLSDGCHTIGGRPVFLLFSRTDEAT